MKMYRAVLLGMVFLLSACASPEEKARQAYNEALLLWQQGDKVNAIKALDALIIDYKSTQVATEAITERQILLGQYAKHFARKDNDRRNQDFFAKTVWDKVQAYQKTHRIWPTHLGELALDKNLDNPKDKQKLSELLSLCEYQVGEFAVGVYVDCSGANAPYVEYYMNTGRLGGLYQDDDDSNNDTSGYRQQQHKTQKPAVAKLEDFAPVKSAWGATLNPSGNVPEQGFNAYYLNVNHPREPLYQEVVENISISFVYNPSERMGNNRGMPVEIAKKLNVESEDFVAYWVGDIALTEGDYQINYDVSQAQFRAYLNGRLIVDETKSQPSIIHLPAGKYRLEVEYINHWHTVGFSLNLTPAIQLLDNDVLYQRLKSFSLPDNTKVYLVGVYEAENFHRTVTVNTAKLAQPFVLMLSSYHAVHWQIEGQTPSAVVYNNANQSSTISGALPPADKRLPVNTMQSGYSVVKQKMDCHCVAGKVICESSSGSLGNIVMTMKSRTAWQVGDIVGAYSGAGFILDPDGITQERLATDEKILQAQREYQAKCKAKQKPNFDTLMQSQ
ncbi:Uncharacterised protein [Suttonella ornithocola]|uniref:PA14 domain n=2 Tax=Suttonella ornithocola TaxID=279832 RepID=A0A380MZK6_9GAMM|nr:Uncharacterised protein [Suttonella ornithocola]